MNENELHELLKKPRNQKVISLTKTGTGSTTCSRACFLIRTGMAICAVPAVWPPESGRSTRTSSVLVFTGLRMWRISEVVIVTSMSPRPGMSPKVLILTCRNGDP